MKNIFLLVFMLSFMVGGAFSPTNYNTASFTYVGSDISVDVAYTALRQVSTCPGSMTVPEPDNSIIAGVDIVYDMTALSLERMNDQRSWLRCTSPNGTDESEVYQGNTGTPGGWGQGTNSYNRMDLDIANAVTPVFGFGVSFELHAGTNHWAAVGCSPDFNKVDDGTWTIEVIHLPAGSPGVPSNPIPEDGKLLVGLDDDLSWDFNGTNDYYDLYFGTDNPPMTKVAEDFPAGATGTYDPGTMTANTQYFWQVIGKNTTNITPGPIWSFYTVCDAPTYPYVEGFDGVTVPALPSCWVPITNKPNNTYCKVETYANIWQSISPPNMVWFVSGAQTSTDDEVYLVLPKVGTISDKVLTMYIKNPINFQSGEIYEFPFTIGTMTDPFDINTFTSFATQTPGFEWELMEVFFTNYVGADEYIAILSEPDFGLANYMDDVTVDLAPACIKPLDITADEVHAEQATISWTELNVPVAGLYNIEYGETGFVQGEGTLLTGITTNPYTIMSLNSATYYDIYVQADCGADEASDWSWPLTILTECLPFAVPFTEDFGEGAPYDLPLCWATIEECGYEFGGIGISSQGYMGNVIWMDNGFDVDSKLLLIGPEIDAAINVNTLRITFMAKANTSNFGELYVGTMSDPTDDVTFTSYQTVVFTEQDSWQLYKVYFNAYAGSDPYIVFKHNSTLENTQLNIDDVTIETIPACVEPYQTYADGMTNSAAMLHWTDPLASATDWDIEVGELGFTPGTATELFAYAPTAAAAATQSYDMTGLSSGTPYDTYIRTNCGTDAESVWEGPVTFQTGFDAMTLPYSEDFEDGLGTTLNDYNNVTDWVTVSDIVHAGDGAAWAELTAENYQVNTLFITGTFDLSAKADQMLTFWHIPKTDGDNDHCYVEISTDGGATFDQLPLSTYFGGGIYRPEEDLDNNPEGPCFDEESYPEYGTGNTIPTNTWWKKEYFDLTDYNTFSNVVFRFRLHLGYNTWPGWWIDDVAIEDLGTPAFTTDPASIAGEATANMPLTSAEITTGNTGNFPASYTASLIYDEVLLIDENFDAGTTLPTGWTIEDGGADGFTWTFADNTNGYNFDGTIHARAYSDDAVSEGVLMDEGLLTPIVDLTSYAYATLQFILSYDDDNAEEDSARVEVFDGTEWIVLAEYFEADEGKLGWQPHQKGTFMQMDVTPYMNANFQVRFWYTDGGGRAYYLAIEDVKLRASMTNPIGWLKIDGAEETSGTTLPDALFMPAPPIAVQMDATGLADGTYTADIVITSTDPGNASTTIPVTFDVIAGFSVDGTLTYANTGMTPLEGCTVDLVNDADEVVVSTTTDAAGWYEITGVLNGDYSIDISCPIPRGGEGLLDVVNTRQFLLGTLSFTALQQLSADVDANGEVGLLDVVQQRQFLLGTITGWAQEDWVFEVQNITITGSNITVDFQGLSSGDPDGSYILPVAE